MEVEETSYDQNVVQYVQYDSEDEDDLMIDEDVADEMQYRLELPDDVVLGEGFDKCGDRCHGVRSKVHSFTHKVAEKWKRKGQGVKDWNQRKKAQVKDSFMNIKDKIQDRAVKAKESYKHKNDIMKQYWNRVKEKQVQHYMKGHQKIIKHVDHYRQGGQKLKKVAKKFIQKHRRTNSDHDGSDTGDDIIEIFEDPKVEIGKPNEVEIPTFQKETFPFDFSNWNSNLNYESTHVPSPHKYKSSRRMQHRRMRLMVHPYAKPVQSTIGQEEKPIRINNFLQDSVSPSGEPETEVKPKKGRWTIEEHNAFLLGYKLLGNQWSSIAEKFVKSRNRKQIISHAQKHFLRKKMEYSKEMAQ